VPFPRKLLQEGEQLVLDLHPHWWFFAGPVATLILAVIAVIGLQVFADWDWAVLGGAGVAVAAALWVIGRYFRWISTNFVVTSDRVIYRSGVLAKKGIEIPLERVNTVFFNQSIFERMLHAGDLVIESGGERGHESFSDIRNPSQVQNEIYKQGELNQNRMFHGGDRPAAELSVPEQLEKLDDLRQRGVISQAEFDAKKAQLLDRM
jgi:uncharacterized membrane protein YdbT with pleckstrin-like domain